MSIAALRAEIRRRRQVIEVSATPRAWKVLSTDGTYHHQLRWDEGQLDVVCDTCLSRHGHNRCWARQRCLDSLIPQAVA